MKKKMVVAIGMCCALAGCSSSKAEGKYYYQSHSGGLDSDTYFDLKKDGTCIMKASGEEKECTWADGIISIGDQSASYKISKNVMTVYFPGTDGESMSFEKK